MTADPPPAFTCPCCGADSWNVTDGLEKYCGACRWWTGNPDLGPDHLARPRPERKGEQ